MFDWCLLGVRPKIWREYCWQTPLIISLLAFFNPPALAQQAAPHSAMVFFWAEDIERPGSNNWRPLGSGFLVSEQGVVLTAKHVIKSVVTGEQIVASISDKSTFAVPIDETDIQCAMANRDVCAVRVPPGAIPSAVDQVFDVECGVLGPNTKLRAMGFTGGGDRFGGVIQPRGEVVGSAMRAGLIPTDLDLVPTMSGGPVLNSRSNVVAIVKGADSTSDNLTFVTPVTAIKPILESLNVQCVKVETKLEQRLRLEAELEKLLEIAGEVEFSISHQNLRVLPALRNYANAPSQQNWNEVVHTVSVVHQRLERAIELEIDFATSLETGGGRQKIEALLNAVSTADQELSTLENNRYRPNRKAYLVRDLALGHSSRSATYRILSGPPIEPADAHIHIRNLEKIASNLKAALSATIEHYKVKIEELHQ